MTVSPAPSGSFPAASTQKGIDMTAPTALARPHLRDDHLEALRALLAEALAEQRHQHDHNAALLHGVFGAPSDDDAGHDRDLIRAAADRTRDAIEEIQAALGRLAEGTYGVCESCERPIPFERLEAIPQARHCVACLRPGGAVR